MQNCAGQLQASRLELIDLLKLCCEELGNVYLIIDGIDECSDSQDLLKLLRSIDSCSSAKMILVSRPNMSNMRRALAISQRVTMDKHAVSDDIRAYFSHCIDSLIDSDDLPAADPSTLVDHLARGADGMFLWATLMIKHLHSVVLTPEKRLSIIEQVTYPEGLDKMYDRILDLIAQSTSLEQTVAQQVFCWLTCCRQPLTAHQLFEAIHIDEPRSVEKVSSEIDAFHDMITVVCGALVSTCTISTKKNPRLLPDQSFHQSRHKSKP